MKQYEKEHCPNCGKNHPECINGVVGMRVLEMDGYENQYVYVTLKCRDCSMVWDIERDIDYPSNLPGLNGECHVGN